MFNTSTYVLNQRFASGESGELKIGDPWNWSSGLIKYIILFLLAIMLGIGLFMLYKRMKKDRSMFYVGGSTYKNKPIKCSTLNIMLDERNFYMANRHVNNALDKLKRHIKKEFKDRKIQFHIVTKNTNLVDYNDEFETYKKRYGSNDILYVASTLFDIERAAKNTNIHHLKARDDLTLLILALEHIDRGEDVIILSNDKFKDVELMFEMPEFNVVRIFRGNIEKRHINPIKYRFVMPRITTLLKKYKLRRDLPKLD